LCPRRRPQESEGKALPFVERPFQERSASQAISKMLTIRDGRVRRLSDPNPQREEESREIWCDSGPSANDAERIGSKRGEPKLSATISIDSAGS
jgi:hypothetical protein